MKANSTWKDMSGRKGYWISHWSAAGFREETKVPTETRTMIARAIQRKMLAPRDRNLSIFAEESSLKLEEPKSKWWKTGPQWWLMKTVALEVRERNSALSYFAGLQHRGLWGSWLSPCSIPHSLIHYYYGGNMTRIFQGNSLVPCNLNFYFLSSSQHYYNWKMDFIVLVHRIPAFYTS